NNNNNMGNPFPDCPDCMHSKYVVGPSSSGSHGIVVPESTTQAGSVACDLNGDGMTDNILGKVFAALNALNPPIVVQTAVDDSFNMGSVIILLDVEYKPALDNTTTAGLKPYNGTHDTTDGLSAPNFYSSGNGKFTLGAADGPGFGGKVMGGAANFGTGNMTIQFPLVAGVPPLSTNL